MEVVSIIEMTQRAVRAETLLQTIWRKALHDRCGVADTVMDAARIMGWGIEEVADEKYKNPAGTD